MQKPLAKSLWRISPHSIKRAWPIPTSPGLSGRSGIYVPRLPVHELHRDPYTVIFHDIWGEVFHGIWCMPTVRRVFPKRRNWSRTGWIDPKALWPVGSEVGTEMPSKRRKNRTPLIVENSQFLCPLLLPEDCIITSFPDQLMGSSRESTAFGPKTDFPQAHQALLKALDRATVKMGYISFFWWSKTNLLARSGALVSCGRFRRAPPASLNRLTSHFDKDVPVLDTESLPEWVIEVRPSFLFNGYPLTAVDTTRQQPLDSSSESGHRLKSPGRG